MDVVLIILCRTSLLNTYDSNAAAAVASLAGCEPGNNIDKGAGQTNTQDSGADNQGGGDEEVDNAIDIEDGPADSFRDGKEVMTTLQPSSSTTEQNTTPPTSSTDDSDLPLCSEVSTLPPRIGIGLINKFSISTTSAPVPCRNAQESVTTASTATTEVEEETTTASGTLFQQLANKFGSGR